MKKFFTSLFIIIGFISNAQEITKDHFVEMRKTTSLIMRDIENKDFSSLELYLKLSPNDAQKLKNALENVYNLKETYTLPYFLLTDAPNKFKMVIPSFKILDKVNSEDFERGNYYFVIIADVIIKPELKEINYKNSSVLAEESEINKWWLSRYKTYLDETLKVRDKFGFVPPPPPCPPKTLQ